MVTLEEYDQFISVHRKFKARVLEVANLLNDLYPEKYEMLASETEAIFFYDDEIVVQTGLYKDGFFDETNLFMNYQFLFMDNDEITSKVINEKHNDETIAAAKNKKNKK